MRRTLCFLLCLLMLSFVRCQKEEPRETGSFYKSCGVQYNSHVRMVIADEELKAPVSVVRVEIQNDSDWKVDIGLLHWTWEKWEDGEWTNELYAPSVHFESDVLTNGSMSLDARSTREAEKHFSNPPLGPGVYRVMMDGYMPNGPDAYDPEKKYADEFKIRLEAYFTVIE